MRGMGGDLVVDPADPGRGATFRLTPPGEPAEEAGRHVPVPGCNRG
jgi:hypothetical protein